MLRPLMSVLIVEPLHSEVMSWLVERHPVRYAPELARDPRPNEPSGR